MKYGLISVIALLFCLLIIGLEYIFHYRLAEEQDDTIARETALRKRLEIRVEGVLYAPTMSSQTEEIQSLSEEIGGDHHSYEMALEIIKEMINTEDEENRKKVEQIKEKLIEVVDPVSIYAKMLDEGDVYHKGYACRRLADLDAVEYKEKIRSFLYDKDRDLSYNSAMALDRLGDTENVAKYILSIQDDRMYSARIINEIFDDFHGDREKLASLLLDECNPYMKNTIIKAVAPYKIEDFREMYIKGATGDDTQMKISCIKALAQFGREEDEQILQMAAQDKDWVIRAAAVRGLSLLKTQSALDSVKNGLFDKQWWVRQAAANSLIKMNISPRDLEDILGGYDRFAADAMKTVLYKTIDNV